jgi:hypothetical protein
MALLKGTLKHPQYEAVVVVDTERGVVSCDRALQRWLEPGAVRTRQIEYDPALDPEGWLRALQVQFKGLAQMTIEEVS